VKSTDYEESIKMSDEIFATRPSKTVILIGELTQEGVTTKIRTMGYFYQQKRLVSSLPQNWTVTKKLISELRASGNLVAVFVHLHVGMIYRCTEEFYRREWQELLAEVIQTKSLIFVYEDNLAGIFDEPIWHKPKENTIEGAKELLRNLYSCGATVVPYRKRIDLTIRIQEFLDEIEDGVLLRLYVPNRRYQAEQLASFLRLLENYLHSVEQKAFSVDVRKAEHGLVYVFKSKDAIQDIGDLDGAISRFESFMELCLNDTASAKAILSKTSLKPAEAEHLISKYLRDYKRLKLDIRHEYEQKALALKQRLENDVYESEPDNIPALTLPSQPSALLSLSHNLGTININYSDKSVHGNQVTQLEVAQTIDGDITYDAEDSQLIALFDKYAERLESIRMKSALEELKDNSSPQETRQTARQKIAGFLYKFAPIIGESVVKGLADYLERKISGMQ
jgi:hypothetical protein